MRLVLLACCLIACGGSSKSPSGTPTTPSPATAKARPKTTTGVHVVVRDGSITFNGVAIGPRPTIAELVAIFGKPDRVWGSPGTNQIHTWDALGVLAYESYDAKRRRGDGRCISATFPFKPMSDTYTPNTLFAGAIELDGKLITERLTLGDVRKLPGATQPYTPQSLLFDRGGFHVFMLEATAGKRLDLVELSFWQHGGEDTPAPAPQGDEDCKRGDLAACTHRALVLQAGLDGRRDFPRAFALAQLACAGGDAFGCLMVGNMHDAGKGTGVDQARAREAWQRACKLGYRPVCE